MMIWLFSFFTALVLWFRLGRKGFQQFGVWTARFSRKQG
jgi:hypothetical protein